MNNGVYKVHADRDRTLKILSLCIIPALLIVFAAIYKIDTSLYMILTQEDHVVEWLTVACLFSSGILGMVLTGRQYRQAGPYTVFCVLFAIACVLFALDEMSWGQRVAGVESPAFFLEHSDQQEINVHNVVQKHFNIKTKHVAGRVLFYFGTVLPILMFDGRIRKFIRKCRILVPHVSLALGFLIAALLMWDRPTGREEELGELFFSICFVLFMVWNVFGNDADKQAQSATDF